MAVAEAGRKSGAWEVGVEKPDGLAEKNPWLSDVYVASVTGNLSWRTRAARQVNSSVSRRMYGRDEITAHIVLVDEGRRSLLYPTFGR